MAYVRPMVLSSSGRRTVGRNVATAKAVGAATTEAVTAAATASALSKRGVGNHQEYDEYSKKLMHCFSPHTAGRTAKRVPRRTLRKRGPSPGL
jgi:hypothetical protein